MKSPAFQFYPGDWLRSTNLRICSMAAQGLWINMLCLMHDCEPYGYLKVGKTSIGNDALARIVGMALEEFVSLLNELENAEVFSRDRSGCIYSRRMVHDEQIRKVRAEAGSLGGKQKATKALAKGLTKPKQTVADADANAEAKEEALKGKGIAKGKTNPEFERFWKAYPRKRSKDQAAKAWNSLQPDEQLQNKILESLELAKTLDFDHRPTDKVPYPATWLNARGWEDEITEGEHRPVTRAPGPKGAFAQMLFEKEGTL